jgi:hypothetical protein
MVAAILMGSCVDKSVVHGSFASGGQNGERIEQATELSLKGLQAEIKLLSIQVSLMLITL